MRRDCPLLHPHTHVTGALRRGGTCAGSRLLSRMSKVRERWAIKALWGPRSATVLSFVRCTVEPDFPIEPPDRGELAGIATRKASQPSL